MNTNMGNTPDSAQNQGAGQVGAPNNGNCQNPYAAAQPIQPNQQYTQQNTHQYTPYQQYAQQGQPPHPYEQGQQYAQPHPCAYTRPAPRPAIPSSRADVIFALLVAVFSVITVDFSLFAGFRLGFSISTLLMTVLAVVYLAISKIRVTPFSLFCLAAAVGGAASFAVYADDFLKFWMFLAIIFLLAAAFSVMTGSARYTADSFRAVGNYLALAVIWPFKYIGDSMRSLFSSNGSAADQKSHKKVIVGILCALPALAVIIPLLISSDAAFEGLLKNTFFGEPVRLLSALILGLGLSVLLYSLLFGLSKKLPSKDAKPVKPVSGKLNSAAVTAFLSVIAFVYAVYLLSQLAYFVSAFSGILPDNYTIAEYARRGFFEMCLICAINLIIVFFCFAFSAKSESGRAALPVKLLSLFFCVFSLAMIACGISKMVMYIDTYGMTRLRICTSVFMLMLAVIFVLVAVRLFAEKFPYVKFAVVAVALIGLATIWYDVDSVIAKYNTEAYFSGKLDEVDVDTIAHLSDSAVPYLLELSEADNEYVAYTAREELESRFWSYYSVDSDENDGNRAYYGEESYDDGYYNDADDSYYNDDGCYSNNNSGATHEEIEATVFKEDSEYDFREYNVTEAKAKKLLYENRFTILEGSTYRTR